MVGERRRAGSDGECNALGGVVNANRREPGGLGDSADSKVRKGLVILCNFDPGYNGSRCRDFAGIVCREDIFTDRLGECIGIRLRGDGRLSPGKELFGHILL